MSTLGKRIKKLRERRKLTQVDAAKVFGLTNTQLSRYESDVHSPDPELLKRFADFYEVSSDWLLGRTNNETNEDELIRDIDLELTDEEIIQKYNLTIDGEALSDEEAKAFIAFVRVKRGIK